jgi:mannose-6-phosphate isomerase
MYPIRFENIYFDKVWGGRDFTLFRDNLPEGEIGESWDVCCHKHGVSVVTNGEFSGMKLDELIKLKGHELLGTKIPLDWFPILIKLINAKEKLSVQVHPDDAYAMKFEGEMGKTEAWYVIEAFEGANLVVGTKKCTKEQLKNAIENGTLNEYMNLVKVQKGEVYFVKSGLIHAIGEGVIIAEIQQNSDTTYRVFDYNRGRELHINKALDVIDLNLKGEKSKGITFKMDGYSKTYYCLSNHFSMELYDIQKSLNDSSDVERFYIFTCVDGEGVMVYKDGYEKIFKGDSIIVPASLGEYELKGKMKVLKCYVPDLIKVEREILSEIEG